MKRPFRMLAYAVLGITAIALTGAGAWIYMTSNVEQPDYEVIVKEGPFEIRAYPALIVAEAWTSGSRQDGVRDGFRSLASYIFAKRRQGPKIAMTAPVTQQPDARDGGRWAVQFVMPAAYAFEDLPDPVDPDVVIRRLPAAERAAVRFSGVADDGLIAEQEARLRSWLERQGRKSSAAPVYAYYNDPFTPGFLRRNEVLFDLSPPE